MTVTYPNIAVVYEAMTGRLRRKIVPGLGETPNFSIDHDEGVIVLHGRPYDDAACRAAVATIVGSIATR